MKGNAEIFLQKYRILEGLLEKRYEGERISASSVVIEYIRDEDSEPVRVDLDLMREIRNILSHNACADGSPVAEPSGEMIDRLDGVIAYVRRPRCASAFGTPADRILSAHENDKVLDIMRAMRKNGYSHVPVKDGGRVVGVFSMRCIFDYLAESGLESLDAGMRIADLGGRIDLDRRNGERYMFVPEDTSILGVRNAFRSYTRRDSRLGMVFVTRNGSPDEELICMLTPWDVLSDQIPTKETSNAAGKERVGKT